MKPFPGEIMRERMSHRFILNEEQIRWLKRYFPTIENYRIAEAMGVNRERVSLFAKEYGLVKSEMGKAAIRRRRDRKMAKTNEKNGCYDRKRGHPCSEATMIGNARRWREEREGIRENVQKRMRREDPERYREWIEKRAQNRRDSVRKERLRVFYGLGRSNKLIISVNPYKRSQIAHRYSAFRRGYVLSDDCSDESPDRYVIYYDGDTKRNERFEANCIKDGFTFREWLW